MVDLDYFIDALGTRTNARFDCPECGRENSLSVSRLITGHKYHCFGLGCNMSGGTSDGLSIESIKKLLDGTTEQIKPFRMPEHWVLGIASEKCLKMLTNAHCLDVYKKGLFHVAYDPSDDRLCFLVLDDSNNIVGAIGRYMGKQKGIPKTKNYAGSEPRPFICGTGDTLVLVEDCFSAASVCRIEGYSGCSLLGTQLKEEYIPYIVKYPRLIVALDKDATIKALDIRQRLTYYHNNVNIWFLENDIKDTEELIYE